MAMQIGDTNTVSTIVDNSSTAKAVASGTLDVFSTPCMIALMEQAASEYVQKHLDGKHSSVGTKMKVKHLMASPVGMAVSATATVTGIDGNKIDFDVEATTPAGVIGAGNHSRFIIEIDTFLKRAYDQLD